jgi:hypothetical protein
MCILWAQGGALLLVFREESYWWGPNSFNVIVDGVYRAQLMSPQFVCLPLPPGQHVVFGDGLVPRLPCLSCVPMLRRLHPRTNVLELTVREGDVVLVWLKRNVNFDGNGHALPYR